MDKVAVTVTVFFEEPFWVSVVERIDEGKLSACKITFGAEPREQQIYDYFLKNYYKLRFSPAVETAVKEMHGNPKRMQKKAKRQMQEAGIGTKSQQALKLQQEKKKTERRAFGREQKEAQNQRKFELKQQKRKEKHKGR
ncbi:MAG: YjdF family protein [Eubacteriales bacterium]|nr:YjdF family protein [Eubacteriales bacterium]